MYICYENPLLTNDYYGVESIIKALVGDRKVQQLRLFPVYNYICCILDSMGVLFLYAIVLVIPSIISQIVISVVSTDSFFAQSIVILLSKLVVLHLVLRFLPKQCRLGYFKTDSRNVTRFSFVSDATFVLYLPLIIILLVYIRSIDLSPSSFASILISPVIEEIVFRGYLCNVLSSRLNPFLGMIFSSLCFCFLHLYSFSTSDTLILFILRVLYSFIGGVAFSCCMFWDGSIIGSILLHTLNNAISVLLSSIGFSSTVNRLLEFLVVFPLIEYSSRFLLKQRKCD